MAIKSLELEPSRENLLNTLSKDLLDRNKDVWQFARFCAAQEGKCSIAIDAQWGAGKTFFIRHVQMLIDSFNKFTLAVTPEEKEQIQYAFSKYMQTDNNENSFEPEVCIYYDAWLNDSDVDPILSLIYEIMKDSTQNYSLNASIDIPSTITKIVDFFTGKNFSQIVDSLKKKDYFSELKSTKDLQDLVTEFLDSLLCEKGYRLIIFVDELDRCKPDYAVKFLERIKHYFSNDRVTFVFSVNISELQHTVKHYYGEGFDACKYLDRFFDYRIELPTANMTKYYQEIGLDESYTFEIICKSVINYCNFGLREIEKFYRMAKVAAYEPTHNKHSLDYREAQNARHLSFCIIAPIAIGLRMMDTTLYNDFLNGEKPDLLYTIIGDSDINRGIFHTLLNNNETYDETVNDSQVRVLLKDKLTEMYQTLFCENGITEFNEIYIGGCAFNNRIKESVLRIISGLSEYMSF